MTSPARWIARLVLPAISRPSPASARASPIAPSGSRICARRWSRPASSPRSTIRPVARAGSDLVDLAVALEPAPMRTVAGEAGYGTGEGIRLELSWQHRNLLPPEGAVTFRGVAGTREQLVSAILRRNNFMRRDQVLNAQVAATHVDRPAYRRAHVHARRRHRAADQHHLAEDLDLVARRRADRDRRARRRHRQRHDPAAHLLHRRDPGLSRL